MLAFCAHIQYLDVRELFHSRDLELFLLCMVFQAGQCSLVDTDDTLLQDQRVKVTIYIMLGVKEI